MASTKGGVGQSTIGADLLYVAGGANGSGVNTTNYEYSQTGNSWSTKTAMTAAKSYGGQSTI